MISYKTIIELVEVIDGYSNKFIDRLFVTFDIDHLIHPILGKVTDHQKVNILLKTLRNPPPKGPFTDSFTIDVIQYIVDDYYRNEDDPGNKNSTFYQKKDHIPYDEHFATSYPALVNSFKRDGYIIKGRTIKKMLPEEIEEAKVESELISLIKSFGFSIAFGHIEQAINNHAHGHWSSANGQFRSFFENLLIEICNKLVPGSKPAGGLAAIKFLSKDVVPPFLSEDLNEVEHNKCSKPFIHGLWNRLHPQGPHPGLSDEEDCTFRYHMLVVVAHSLLKRLGKRV